MYLKRAAALSKKTTTQIMAFRVNENSTDKYLHPPFLLDNTRIQLQLPTATLRRTIYYQMDLHVENATTNRYRWDNTTQANSPGGFTLLLTNTRRWNLESRHGARPSRPFVLPHDPGLACHTSPARRARF